jgi:hypothetical protein
MEPVDAVPCMNVFLWHGLMQVLRTTDQTFAVYGVSTPDHQTTFLRSLEESQGDWPLANVLSHTALAVARIAAPGRPRYPSRGLNVVLCFQQNQHSGQ